MAKTALNWTNIKATDLPESFRPTFMAIMEARKAFEEQFISAARAAGELPEGKTLKFSHRGEEFGVAVADVPKAKPAGGGFKFLSA